MENNNNENYGQGYRDSQESEKRNYGGENASENTQNPFEKEQSNLSGTAGEESDDFHKNDDLSHNQDGERIDSSGTDPNRYSNLASQDTGSSRSIYNDDEKNASADDSEQDDYDSEDISDEAYSDEEEELQDNEANRFKSNSDPEERNTSRDGTFFNEGI